MNTKARKLKVKRLYRLYNIKQSKFGQPFCLCDFHYMAWTPPVTCIVEKIAERALWPCNDCDSEVEIEAVIPYPKTAPCNKTKYVRTPEGDWAVEALDLELERE